MGAAPARPWEHRAPDGNGLRPALRIRRSRNERRTQGGGESDQDLAGGEFLVNQHQLPRGVAAGLAFFAEYRQPGQGMATLGWAVVGVIIVNGLFSFWQEYRAEKALAALRNLLPRHTTPLRDGRAVQLPLADLVPGDVVLLAAGDDVPADCRLIEAFGVRVNTATLTGESRPKARDTAPTGEEQVALRRDVLHAGTSLISGEAKAMVYATGMHTGFGNIARLTQTLHEPLSPPGASVRWDQLLT